jgi:hypothetical protein
LRPEPWRSHWTSTTWQEYLSAGETETRLAVIRQCTHTGRPLGTEEFIQDLEKGTQRRIALHILLSPGLGRRLEMNKDT